MERIYKNDQPAIRKKTLHLTLKKEWFDLMISGEKNVEVRSPSQWIRSRLEGKFYEKIRFVNGYGADKPFFEVEYLGYYVAQGLDLFIFKGNKLEIKKGDYVIWLGEIITKGNI